MKYNTITSGDAPWKIQRDGEFQPVAMTHQVGFSEEWEQQPCGVRVIVHAQGIELPEDALFRAIQDHRESCTDCAVIGPIGFRNNVTLR